MQFGRGWGIPVTVCALLGSLLGTAHGALAPPVVRIDGGTGVPGGTVAAAIALANDPAGAAVSGTIDVAFPSPPLDAGATACTLAERLAGTHQLTTAAPQPGRLALTILPRAGVPPLGDGVLASCDFTIALGAPAGTAALDLAALLADSAGEPIATDAVDGFLTIDAPLPTPTVTRTPTHTPVPVPTDTPTATPTATRFVPTVLIEHMNSCAIAPPARAGALPLLLGLVLLLAGRRRP